MNFFIEKNRLLYKLLFIFINSFLISPLSAQIDTASIIWNLERLDQLGGYPVIQYGTPAVIPTPTGQAIYFSGSSITCDGLLVESDPLDHATEFTLEALIRIDSSTSLKQKYVHIENPDNNYSQKRRILMEYEKASDSTWFFHGYVAVGSTNYTLASASYPHPYNQWHYVAIVYKDSVVKSFINGIEELSGNFVFLPITDGHISIGRRMNNEANSWFKGAIQTLRFTPKALPPSELLTPQISTVEKTNLHADYFQLDQNYPNPFNPTTSIDYRVMKDAHVTLLVYDVLGRNIATLVDERKRAGNYSVIFHGFHLPSGIYFYTLSTIGYSCSRKMVVLN